MIKPDEIVKGAQFEALHSDDGCWYPCTVETLTSKKSTAKVTFPLMAERNHRKVIMFELPLTYLRYPQAEGEEDESESQSESESESESSESSESEDDEKETAADQGSGEEMETLALSGNLVMDEMAGNFQAKAKSIKQRVWKSLLHNIIKLYLF